MNSLKGAVIQWEDKYKYASGDKFKLPPPLPNLEHRALVELFEATHGFRWRDHSGWTGYPVGVSKLGLEHFAMHPAFWHGLECGKTKPTPNRPKVESFVEALQLSANNLEGTLPDRSSPDTNRTD